MTKQADDLLVVGVALVLVRRVIMLGVLLGLIGFVAGVLGVVG